MSRKSLRSQLDELRRDKELLESENARLKAAKDEEASQLAELDKLRRENERLAKEKDEAEAELRDERGRTELTTEVPLEEQRQLYEDIQAELTEAVERGNSLEDRCSSLEDRLVQVMEEGEVERLRCHVEMGTPPPFGDPGSP
jgi:Mg2+ and Co2+ transporter CorA